MIQFAPAGSIILSFIPELILAIGALVLLLAGSWNGDSFKPTSFITKGAIFVSFLTAAAVIVAWMGGGFGTDDGRVAGDGFRYAMNLVLLVGTIGSLALLDTENARTGAYQAEVPVLILLALFGMMVLTAARDLMLVFIGLELMSLAVYVLAGSNRSSARSAESSMKYFLLGAFSSGFLLYGMALLYGASGDTRFAALAQAEVGPLFIAGVALCLTGVAFKVAAVPFHMWTADVYDGAPGPVTAFMAACVKAAAFAMAVRLFAEGFGSAISYWHPVVWWLAAATMLIGNLVALSQKNLKRMLAYSSIAHAGYLLVGVLAFTGAAVSAVVFYLLAYTLATLAAFSVLGMVANTHDGAPGFDDIKGLWHVRPAMAVVLAVSLLAFLGFPIAGGAGFFAKWYILQAALASSSSLGILVIVLIISSVISAGYYLSAIAVMFNEKRDSEAPAIGATPLLSRVVMLVSVALLLILGVYPLPAAKFATASSLEQSPSISVVSGIAGME